MWSGTKGLVAARTGTKIGAELAGSGSRQGPRAALPRPNRTGVKRRAATEKDRRMGMAKKKTTKRLKHGKKLKATKTLTISKYADKTSPL
jgi:hypothetical protein